MAETRRTGALDLGDGAVRWRVWAPFAKEVNLVLVGSGGRSYRMRPEEDGYFSHAQVDVEEGQRYAYWLDGGPERPDPCSLWQPEDVMGPSAVVRPDRFAWTDQSWRGVRREDLVFYELHVGTFTPEGTFEAIIPRLASLKELGITAVELMPVGQFPGGRNWGYDGVLIYAAQNTYGGPHGLARLVDACHAAGLAVFLDVVYNHVGPEGNYLSTFGPYFTDRYKTPWGRAINYDDAGSDGVRDFVLDNVRMWLKEFHFDGLRLDAIHAIYDMGARHIVRAIKQVADEVSEQTGRHVHIVAESDLNDPRVVTSPDRGGFGADAQWSDDFHHAVHAYLSGESSGYYQDYGKVEQLTKVLEQPFLYAGIYSKHRQRKHGAPCADVPGDRFVVCIQNHDQIGNRAKGDRLTTILGSGPKQRLAGSLMLLSAHLPLLFMGEEYGEDSPFPFFCSFCDENLIRSVREGRKKEFESFCWTGGMPDPQGEETFIAAKLKWTWPEGTLASALRRMHRDLLEARREWPGMRDFVHRSTRLIGHKDNAGVIEMLRGGMRVYFNVTGEAMAIDEDVRSREALLFSSEAKHYMGSRTEVERVGTLAPYESVVIGPGEWRRYVQVSGSASWF